MVDLHAELQAHFAQDLFDLIERLVAEILGLQHLLLRLLHQLADILDISVLQTVLRAHGKFELIDAPEEVIIQWNRWPVIAPFLLWLILEINENTHLVLENLRGVCHRVIRFNAAVGVNFKDDPVIVRALPNARVGNRKIYLSGPVKKSHR